jgi:hypothetical protein
VVRSVCAAVKVWLHLPRPSDDLAEPGPGPLQPGPGSMLSGPGLLQPTIPVSELSELIAGFSEPTGARNDVARAWLAAHKYNLEDALSAYYTAPSTDDDAAPAGESPSPTAHLSITTIVTHTV